MRKFLYIVGASTVVLVVAACIGIAVIVVKGRELDAESKAYVDNAIPAVAAHWRKQDLLDRATPELRRSVTPGQLQALFENFAQLGRLVDYQGAKGDANMAYFTGSGASITASYVAKARFENGNVIFRILLKKQDDHWLIHGFHVDPDPDAPKRPAVRGASLHRNVASTGKSDSEPNNIFDSRAKTSL